MRISIALVIFTIIFQIISSAKFLKEGPNGKPEKSNENKGNNHPQESSKGNKSEEVTESNENKGNGKVKEKSHPPKIGKKGEDN